jgi:UDP-glucose 4-epimerase
LGKPQNLVPFITQTAAGLLKQLTVFGSDYNTIDGTCIRDYIDVVDLAQAHVAALQKLEGGITPKKYDVFNLGTGNGTSVLEVINTFEKTTGIQLNYTIGERRPGDVEAVYAKTDKANQYLDWRATTSLSDSLLNAWKWEKKIRNIKDS